MLDRLFGGFLVKAGKVDGKTAGKYLRDLAVCANAVDAWFHAAHLATTGTGFAGDHALLYGEVYESAGDAFDALMERAIGLSKDRTLADPAPIASDTAAKLRDWPSPVGPAEEIAGGSSDVVTYFLDEIKAQTEAMRDAGALSQGADNLLAQIADDFEGFGYKLGQRVQKGGERASHKYIRRVPKAGGGYEYFYHDTQVSKATHDKIAEHSNTGHMSDEIPGKLEHDAAHAALAHGYESAEHKSARKAADEAWSARAAHVGREQARAEREGWRKRQSMRDAGARRTVKLAGSSGGSGVMGAAKIQKGSDVDALIAKVMAGGLDKSSAIAALKSRGVIKQDGEHLVMAKRKRKPGAGKYGTAANKRAIEIANGAPMGSRPVQEMLV